MANLQTCPRQGNLAEEMVLVVSYRLIFVKRMLVWHLDFSETAQLKC